MNITEEDIQKAAEEANAMQLDTYRKGCQIEVLEEILSKGHGGGNWRRIIMMKIDRLRGDDPDTILDKKNEKC